MRIRAFQGLRPDPPLASQVASLPYDVVDTAEATALAEGNPISFLHVVRAEIDLPEGTDLHAPAVYAKARENLELLQSRGALVREPTPCMYVYEQETDGHHQKGLVSVSHIGDYENGLIKKHEKTRPDKEDDRTTLNRTLGAHPGPVFLTYKDDPKVDRMVGEVTDGEPLINFVAPDGVRHTIWRVEGDGGFVEAFAEIPATYVADGHHRSASAARVGAERRAANPEHTGEEDYNWFPTVSFPASQLKVLPYNRLVHDLNGHSSESFLRAVREVAEVTDIADPSPRKCGDVSMFLDGTWHGLTFPEDPAADPISRLDVSKLQDKILDPLLAVGDPRTSTRIDFIGGIRGTKELEKRVTRGDGPVAFSLYPVTVRQLMDIADANVIMPPKSTWFEPKLRSGLFVHTF